MKSRDVRMDQVVTDLSGLILDIAAVDLADREVLELVTCEKAVFESIAQEGLESASVGRIFSIFANRLVGRDWPKGLDNDLNFFLDLREAAALKGYRLSPLSKGVLLRESA